MPKTTEKPQKKTAVDTVEDLIKKASEPVEVNTDAPFIEWAEEIESRVVEKYSGVELVKLEQALAEAGRRLREVRKNLINPLRGP